MEYLDDAEDAFAKRRFKACASNSCIATIRASDAVCVLELGEQWSGRDHSGATTLLRKSTLGDRGAALLGIATGAKNGQQYRTVATTRAEALELLEGAREMCHLAREVVRRSGYPVA